MQRRNFPTILLYGFGLALALSLVFNGFLLYKQSHQRSRYQDELSSSVYRIDELARPQQRANQRQDSRFAGPTHSPVGAGAQRPSR